MRIQVPSLGPVSAWPSIWRGASRNTSHYVLCGISIPVKYWKRCDKQIAGIKAKYGLANAEIHTGWIKRTYLEQTKIPDFDKLSYADRRSAGQTSILQFALIFMLSCRQIVK